MGSASVSQGNAGWTVSADITWDEGPEVTVEITYNSMGSGWRIRGKNPDTTVYLEGSGSTWSGTFDAEDGTTYYFQAVDKSSGDFTAGDAFTVDFGGDDSGGDDSGDSGDDSGGGGTTVVPNILHIIQGEGTKITVERTWSDYGDYTNSTIGQVFLNDGDTIYYPADRFVITAEALPGYEIDYYDFIDDSSLSTIQLPFYLENLGMSGSGRYKQISSADVTVGATATITSTVHIHDGTNFNPYLCCIYNGSTWDTYTPYIHDGTDWYRYS